MQVQFPPGAPRKLEEFAPSIKHPLRGYLIPFLLMFSYHIQTHGCQMNYSDTERTETYLNALGFQKEKDLKKADLIIFNSCSVRKRVEDKILGQMGTISKLKKKNPRLTVILMGCMAKISSSKYSPKRDPLLNQVRELDIVLKTEDLQRLASLLREIHPKIKIKKLKEESLKDYFLIEASNNSFKSKAQAFLPISNGCDKFCTYCIVPFSRGREKSRPQNEILNEAEKLVENGCKEIILLGQTVNSYKPSFADLLKELDKLYDKGLRRVRFTSPHPKDMSDDLIDAMSRLKTQMPYLHLPLQSGDNNVLKRMNRPYSTSQYRKIIQKLRKKIPDISISTDIIVGFCGETDKEFENTCKFFKEMKFEHAYHAQYSQREGTYAAKFLKDDIPSKIKKKRWIVLNDILRQQSKNSLKRFLRRTVNVLVEGKKKNLYFGRDEHFKLIRFKSEKNLLGQIVPVKITKAKEWELQGRHQAPGTKCA